MRAVSLPLRPSMETRSASRASMVSARLSPSSTCASMDLRSSDIAIVQSFPKPIKNRPGPTLPKDGCLRGTTLIDVRVFSRARPLVVPRTVGPTASLLAGRAARFEVAAGGVNSGRQPWRDLSAGEPHLLSAGDATTKPLRHCLGGMVARWGGDEEGGAKRA